MMTEAPKKSKLAGDGDTGESNPEVEKKNREDTG